MKNRFLFIFLILSTFFLSPGDSVFAGEKPESGQKSKKQNLDWDIAMEVLGENLVDEAQRNLVDEAQGKDFKSNLLVGDFTGPEKGEDLLALNTWLKPKECASLPFFRS